MRLSMDKIRHYSEYIKEIGEFVSYADMLLVDPNYVSCLMKKGEWVCTPIAKKFVEEIIKLPTYSARKEFYIKESFRYYLDEQKSISDSVKQAESERLEKEKIKKQQESIRENNDRLWVKTIIEKPKRVLSVIRLKERFTGQIVNIQ